MAACDEQLLITAVERRLRYFILAICATVTGGANGMEVLHF